MKTHLVSDSQCAISVSVIICTYNRAESLCQTLESFCQLQIPQEIKWELIVVDNNSTDDTRGICRKYQAKLPIRYIFEPRQGKNLAQNSGISQASGQIIAVTDDDVDVDPAWLSNLWNASKQYTEANVFGGRVLPKWEYPPPYWLLQSWKTTLAGVAVYYDRGDVARALEPEESAFYGVNMAFRSNVFTSGHKFREDIGMTGNQPLPGDETWLINRILADGGKAIYLPSAVIYHRNPRERMTEQYVRKWFKGDGICQVRLGSIDITHSWFGIPRYVWRQLIESSLKYLCTRWTRSSNIWLCAEIRMATAWGIITELRRQARVRKQVGVKDQRSSVEG